PDVAFDLNRGVHENKMVASTGAHGGVAAGGKAQVVIGKDHLQTGALPILSLLIAMACQLLKIGQCIIGRAIINDYQFDVMRSAMPANTLDTTLEVFPAIVCQEVHRKLKEISRRRVIGDIDGTGNDGELLFWPPRQHQGTTRSISQLVAGRFKLPANLVGRFVIFAMT